MRAMVTACIHELCMISSGFDSLGSLFPFYALATAYPELLEGVLLHIF